jgi:hypothetical protein
MAMWSKDFLIEFIELSKTEECLCKITSKDYHNRGKRDTSYGSLVSKEKNAEPNAT